MYIAISEINDSTLATAPHIARPLSSPIASPMLLIGSYLRPHNHCIACENNIVHVIT